MFEKYRIYQFGSWYGISKRFLLFFYRRLSYTKSVVYDEGGTGQSQELLLYPTIEGATCEVVNMIWLGTETKVLHYKGGQLMKVERG